MEKQGYRETLEFIIEKFPEDKKTVLTVKEAALVLNSNIDTVYRAINRKRNPLPAKKLCGKTIIPIPALARWMC